MTALHRWHGVAFLALAVGWLAMPALSMEAQVTLLAVLVAVLGVPHGALDPAIAHAAGLWRSRRGLVVFLALYAAIASLVVVAWWQAPTATLAGFLGISAWHFSGDWRHHLPLVARLSAGVAVISIPALAHPEDVRAIFSVLTPAPEAAALCTVLRVVALCAMTMGIVSISTTRPSRRAVAEIVAIGILAWTLPPLVYFVAYFCFLHSPRHLIETFGALKQYMPGQLLRALVPTTLATIVLAYAAFLAIPAASPSDALLRLVFIGLAALTVPHMCLIEIANRSMQHNSNLEQDPHRNARPSSPLH